MDDTEILASLFKQLLAGAVLRERDGHWRLFLPGGHYIFLRNDQELEAVRHALADRQRGLDRQKEHSTKFSERG